jgi:V8-like Glu-specific endopeptidase
MSRHAGRAGAIGSLVLVGLVCVAFGATRRAPRATHASTPVITSATVGALFTGATGDGHTCTASVVDSPAGNLILTAAHCVSDAVAGARFVPGYHDGVAPYGTWIVRKATVDPRWTSSRAPAADVAFLTVSPAPTNRTRASVQAVVGASILAAAPTEGSRIVVSGYRADEESPVDCDAQIYLSGGWPTFDCDGFADGTSGSPWIVDFNPATGTGLVAGIIGGPEQGGSTEGTSYSPTFDDAVLDLARRAMAGS